MAFLSLGLSSIPWPARPAAGPPLEEFGTTGTPVFGGGFLRDLGEYNSEFQGGPFSAFRVYEQMRRSDAQVAATLAAIKLPIRCAEWQLVAPKDATPIEREAADFVRQCLLNEIDFDVVLQNALLMLDFGVAAHEDVWAIDGGKVKLKKLAARLPMTFYNWITDPVSEDVRALVQMGYKGGAHIRTEIPVEKLAIFTHQAEGGNYAGRSLLRAMYQHWYIKANLYKIDAIAAERGGMGIPWMAMGPDAKAEDRKTAIGWMQNLTAHEKAAIVVPNGWTFKLEGVTGQIRDAKESIHHHNMQISMAGLSMFMMLGESSKGNRGLGETMSDFFLLSLQATANQVARTFNLTTIKRLVNYNFPGVRAPKLVPQQVLSFKLETIVDALSKLATSSMVTPGPEMESWLRRKLGAPEAAEPRVQPAAPSATADIPPTQVGAKNAKSGRGKWQEGGLEIPITGR